MVGHLLPPTGFFSGTKAADTKPGFAIEGAYIGAR
jgi:hypothetical protein